MDSTVSGSCVHRYVPLASRSDCSQGVGTVTTGQPFGVVQAALELRARRGGGQGVVRRAGHREPLLDEVARVDAEEHLAIGAHALGRLHLAPLQQHAAAALALARGARGEQVAAGPQVGGHEAVAPAPSALGAAHLRHHRRADAALGGQQALRRHVVEALLLDVEGERVRLRRARSRTRRAPRAAARAAAGSSACTCSAAAGAAAAAGAGAPAG